MVKSKGGFLFLGQYGSTQAELFHKTKYPILAMNTATSDLDSATEIEDDCKYHIQGGEGCNKDRKKSKELLRKDMDNIINVVKEKFGNVEYIVIFGSTGGGSASGQLPSMKRILINELDIKFCCVVTVLPDIRIESTQALLNSYETLAELEQLSELPGATFILDNSRVNDRMKINETFFKYFDALLTSNGVSKLGNVDEAEIEQMLMTPGMSIISSIHKDNVNTQTLLKTFKNNIFAPLEEDKIIKYIALINGDDGKKIDISEIYEQIGKPLDLYLGYEAGDYTLCVLSGLSLPYTRMEEIKGIIEANKDTINHNISAQRNNRLSTGLNFFESIEQPVIKEEKKKKVSSRDLLL